LNEIIHFFAGIGLVTCAAGAAFCAASLWYDYRYRRRIRKILDDERE
jgi:hypothetical protein